MKLNEISSNFNERFMNLSELSTVQSQISAMRSVLQFVLVKGQILYRKLGLGCFGDVFF